MLFHKVHQFSQTLTISGLVLSKCCLFYYLSPFDRKKCPVFFNRSSSELHKFCLHLRGEGLLLSITQHNSSSLLSYPHGVYFTKSMWNPSFYSGNKHLNIVSFPLCLPVFAKMLLIAISAESFVVCMFTLMFLLGSFLQKLEHRYWTIFTYFKNYILPNTTEEKFQL